MERKNLVKVTVEYDGEARPAEGDAVYGVVFSYEEDCYDANTFLMGEASLVDLANVICGSIVELDGLYDGLCSLVIEGLYLEKLRQLREDEEAE